MHGLTQHQYLRAASTVEHFQVWKPQGKGSDFTPTQETSHIKLPWSTRDIKAPKPSVKPKGDAKPLDMFESGLELKMEV